MKKPWPSINHSILSPSGKMSKKARAEAMEIERKRIFPPGYWDSFKKTEAQIREEKIKQLKYHVKRLREIADRGVHPRKFRKEADLADREIEDLQRESEKHNEPPICPFCEFRETEIDKEGNLLLCETCARGLADACDRAHHINCCDW